MNSVEKLRRAVGSAGISLAVLALVGAATVAVAHHTSVMYDGKKLVTFQGSVAKFQWANPHIFVLLDVPSADGTGTTRYTWELAAPSYMKRHGWSHDTLKVGEKITVVAYPLRDGRPGGALHEVTFANGRKLVGYTGFEALEEILDKDGRIVGDHYYLDKKTPAEKDPPPAEKK